MSSHKNSAATLDDTPRPSAADRDNDTSETKSDRARHSPTRRGMSHCSKGRMFFCVIRLV